MDRRTEDLLESIYTAEDWRDAAHPDDGAAYDKPMGAEDLARLEAEGLVRREGEGAVLTDAGRAVAREITRRHRLAELLFRNVLCMGMDKTSSVACEVEHSLQPEVVESICTLLGHPSTCPHGYPIPPGKCCEARQRVVESLIVPLTELAPGEKGRIAYIRPKSHGRLHQLTSFGLTPGVVVELHQRSPAFCVQYEETELALDSDVAEDIYVSRVR